ncbi:glycosyl hydrolase family 28-related protein [Bacillus albus]|uniref:glycosyl hydrolase family 28-related protein n=1 Tax=Bacillus cereus group TaxID=86661 RepID=UPI0022E5914A|nr:MULTISPECIES: glycosyl hydrolase family 28-related protein [Bacillus cereus group]MDA2216892.1 glycosyl hydrolase family 28-related protein [Bacillus cereus group sp. Bc228]MDA2226173.1 glycosyl hydrolase family 28-related protein [Bacillus cereus group sp. Bc227]
MPIKLKRWGDTAQNRTFRNDTNSNWDQLERSHNKIQEVSEQAVNDSSVAKEQAISANSTSESVQKQLDTLVLSGDSSVEAAQARTNANGVTKSTLKQRADDDYKELTSLLSDISLNIKKSGAVGDNATDCTQMIQGMINKLEGKGGEILIPEGKFIVSQLKIPSYVSLVGTGRKSILKQKSGSNIPLITLKKDTSQMIGIKNLTIDGNKANQTSDLAGGIELINTIESAAIYNDSLVGEHDARHFIENIYIYETKGTGFRITGRGESQVKAVQTLRCDKNGFYLDSQDNWYESLSAGESGLQGIISSDKDGNSRFINCKSWFSGKLDQEQGDGFDIRGTRIGLIGCEAQDNSKHGFVFKGKDIVGSGLIADTNGWQYISGNVYTGATGFLLYGAKNCNIQGIASNRFGATDPRQSYALQLLNNAAGNNITISSMYMKMSSIIQSQLSLSNVVNISETDITGKVTHRIKANNLSLNTENYGEATAFYARSAQEKGHSTGPILRLDHSDAQGTVARLEKYNGDGTTKARWDFKINHENRELLLTPIESGGPFAVDAILKTIHHTWNGKHFQMGDYHFWVDGAKNLRVRKGAPTNDTDGTIIVNVP